MACDNPIDTVRAAPGEPDGSCPITQNFEALNGEIKVWLDQDATKERFKTMAGYSAYTTPEQFSDFVQKQIAQWRGVIEKEGLKLDVN